jgi:transglutaminase/protease-like cytokinesis protein 3
MTIYDTSAVLAAFEAGSDEGLNRKDRELYHGCKEVLEQVIREGMSDYEKEWAIYSWLVTNVDYDWSHNDPAQTTPRDSYHPYGAVVRREAVCLGFATAFQLFMDLLEVECITVVGAAFHSLDAHAWNMVRLNGEWYCVDATWDRGRGGSPNICGYFNVTSDRMAKTDHQWDYENTPMATATDGGISE